MQKPNKHYQQGKQGTKLELKMFQGEQQESTKRRGICVDFVPLAVLIVLTWCLFLYYENYQFKLYFQQTQGFVSNQFNQFFFCHCLLQKLKSDNVFVNATDCYVFLGEFVNSNNGRKTLGTEPILRGTKPVVPGANETVFIKNEMDTLSQFKYLVANPAHCKLTSTTKDNIRIKSKQINRENDLIGNRARRTTFNFKVYPKPKQQAGI